MSPFHSHLGAILQGIPRSQIPVFSFHGHCWAGMGEALGEDAEEQSGALL